MKIEKDDLLYSPKDTFDKIDFDDKEKLTRAFRNRVYGFYLYPAKKLDEKKLGFGAGLLCIATLESLARMKYPEHDKKTNEYKITPEKFVTWLGENIPEFRDYSFAEKFYRDFRCGLVHEGRIKNLGQFSYRQPELVVCEECIMMINPTLLLERTREVLEKYLISLREDVNMFNQFKEGLVRDFGSEVRRAKGLL